MQTHDPVYITPGEWRWVILVSTGLVLLAFLPFVWVAASGSGGNQWQFMGILNNYRDGATYLAKMIQGSEGNWLTHFLHTPEDHNGAVLQIIYPALGYLARLTTISPIALFHAARVVASLIMYMTLYYLGATIWTRVRTRRVFLVLVAIGAGFGWLLGPLTGDARFPDLTIPEMFPFYSSAVNVHFPLALASLAIMMSVLIQTFRPGMDESPTINNGGLTVSLLSLALALLYPQALVPLLVALAIYIVLRFWSTRRFSLRELRWGLAVLLPVIPLGVYYALIVSLNPVIQTWNAQNVTPAPPPLILILGLGLPLVMAVPGFWRAIRRFEPDGDQMMLLWLVAILVLLYFPTNIQRRFTAGMMIPLAYFGTRALEDFWFQRMSRPWRYRLAALVVVVMSLSQLLAVFAPVLPLTGGHPERATGLFLQQDYRAAFDWLSHSVRPDMVVLASPNVSIWLPGWTGARVVYGHPFESMDAAAREKAVIAWYSDPPPEDCDALLHTDTYTVNYVLVGPQEKALGSAACAENLRLIAQLGSVAVYAP
ncbi:MAG: hypothetical protein K8I60_19690 [Anaerolineae bacterium]|nr:hypothetical protein [Anaerolineae bacterium]